MEQLLTTTDFDGLDLSGGGEVFLNMSGSSLSGSSSVVAKHTLCRVLFSGTVGNTYIVKIYTQVSSVQIHLIAEIECEMTSAIMSLDSIINTGSVVDGSTIGINITIQSDNSAGSDTDVDVVANLYLMTPFDANGRVDVATVNGLTPLDENDIVDLILAEPATPIANETITGKVAVQGTATLDTITAFMEADLFVDDSKSPWELVYIQKGTGIIGVGTELLRKVLRDTDGTGVIATSQPVGQQINTATE